MSDKEKWMKHVSDDREAATTINIYIFPIIFPKLL